MCFDKYICVCDRLAIRDHFHETISDLICEKGLLLKHLKNSFVYIQLLYIHNYSVCIQNCFLRCFNSVFLTNQAMTVLIEVVPFCKSGHTHTHTHTHIYICMYVCIYIYHINR